MYPRVGNTITITVGLFATYRTSVRAAVLVAGQRALLGSARLPIGAVCTEISCYESADIRLLSHWNNLVLCRVMACRVVLWRAW